MVELVYKFDEKSTENVSKGKSTADRNDFVSKSFCHLQCGCVETLL